MFFPRCFRESLGKEHLPVQDNGSMWHKKEASHYRAEKRSQHPGWWKKHRSRCYSKDYRITESMRLEKISDIIKSNL